MFIKQYNAYLDNCIKELMECKNKRLARALEAVKTVDPETFEKRIKGIIVNFTSDIFHNDWNEAQAEAAFFKVLTDMADYTEEMKYVLDIEVKTRGLENVLNRSLRLPMTMTVADLGYYILASVAADGDSTFTIIYQGQKYQCTAAGADDADENAMPAQMVPLSLLKLKKWDRLAMVYGDDDPYEFDIYVRKVTPVDHISSYEDAKILGGSGYGIWECGRTLHEIYLMGTKKEFKAQLKESMFELDFFPYDETFDLQEANESFMEDMFEIKMNCEEGEMNSFDFESDDDDIFLS